MGILKDLLFGQSYNEAVSPAKEAYQAAKDDVATTKWNAFKNNEFYQNNKDLFAKIEESNPGFTDSFTYSTYGKGLNDAVKSRQQIADDMKGEYTKALRQNKYNILGNGILGSLLSPFFGVADVGGDLLTGRIGDRYSRDSNNDGITDNDLTQDIGSFLSAGLNVASGGNALSSGNMLAKVLKGAGLNAVQNATYNLHQNGDETWNDPSSLADDVLMGAAIGGAFPVAAAGLGKVGKGVSNALSKRGVSASTAAKMGKAAQIGTGVGVGAIGLNTLLGGNRSQAQDNTYSGYTNNQDYYGGVY